jgi:CubicO group peptidase (beta-lactamase class C family)
MHNVSRMTRVLTLLTACSLFASGASAQRGGRVPVPQKHPVPLLTAAQLQELDSYIPKAMAASKIPGLSIAIVQGDSVVFAKGYGVKELGKPDKVDERTLFAIGSNGKTTTASFISMLVDEGKMRWDDPVWKYLPGFRVADPYVSQTVTIRDLMSHRTDLENNTAVWYGAPLTRAQVIEKLRFLKLEAPFRSRFSYNNLMVMVAGEAAAAAAGTTWENLIRQRIFAPLGMTSSITSSRELKPGDNVASPHAVFHGKEVPIPHFDNTNIGPAGAVYSSAIDMAQYLRLHLNNGVYKGKRLISEQSMADMRTLTSPGGSGPTFRTDTTVSEFGYGLGWFIDDFRGHPVVRHGGAVDGELSDLRMLPNEQVGVVILTNFSPHTMHSALTYHIFDMVLGLPQRQWDPRMQSGGAAIAAAGQGRGAAIPRPENASISMPLDKYVGIYSDSMTGDVKVSLENGKLMLNYRPGFTAILEPWQYNTFLVDWQMPSVIGNGQPFATFNVGSTGRVTEVTVSVLGTFRAAANGGRGGGRGGGR